MQGWIEMGGGGGAKSYTPSQKGGGGVQGGVYIKFRSKGGGFRGVYIKFRSKGVGGGGGAHPLHHPPGSSPAVDVQPVLHTLAHCKISHLASSVQGHDVYIAK